MRVKLNDVGTAVQLVLICLYSSVLISGSIHIADVGALPRCAGQMEGPHPKQQAQAEAC